MGVGIDPLGLDARHPGRRDGRPIMQMITEANAPDGNSASTRATATQTPSAPFAHCWEKKAWGYVALVHFAAIQTARRPPGSAPCSDAQGIGTHIPLGGGHS